MVLQSSSSPQWLVPTAIAGIGGLIIGMMLTGNDNNNHKWRRHHYGKMKYNRIGNDDDVYLVSDDQDTTKIDITRPKNMHRKLKDMKMKKVMYGDKNNTFSGFVNTISPYGQGLSNELTRLPGFSDQSRVNTFSNSINLY